LKKCPLSKFDVKRALKPILEALAKLHDQGIAHTGTSVEQRGWLFCGRSRETDSILIEIDVKPGNILLSNSSTRGMEYRLGHLGDSSFPDVASNDGGPRVLLGIPWPTKADIWGLGATVRFTVSSSLMQIWQQGITLMTGRFISLHKNAPPCEKQPSMAVL
jgi:serine/threonine protein kinase